MAMAGRFDAGFRVATNRYICCGPARCNAGGVSGYVGSSEQFLSRKRSETILDTAMRATAVLAASPSRRTSAAQT